MTDTNRIDHAMLLALLEQAEREGARAAERAYRAHGRVLDAPTASDYAPLYALAARHGFTLDPDAPGGLDLASPFGAGYLMRAAELRVQ
jgi:hypothetical protein